VVLAALVALQVGGDDRLDAAVRDDPHGGDGDVAGDRDDPAGIAPGQGRGHADDVEGRRDLSLEVPADRVAQR
jgi:hypothetical protein